MNVDPELRKRVEQIKASPVQLYREAGDYSNRELVEGIVVSPDDIAAIGAVARGDFDVEEVARKRSTVRLPVWTTASDLRSRSPPSTPVLPWRIRAEAAHHRMVEPDHYQRWER
jgi:hypothetical protein